MSDNVELQDPAARGPAAALGLGERLRSARTARALSVQQVAEALRLEEPGVLALEEGRFEDMGAPVFVRGHLRRYAQLVGLPPEAVLDAYRAAAPGSDAPPSLARPRAQADTVRVPAWAFWIIGALVLAGALAALLRGAGEDAPPAGAPVAATAPAAAPPAAGAPAAEALAPGTARLALDFRQDSWVEIDDAERRVLYGLQTGGTRQELVVRTPVKLMLGNARGVVVALDGAPVALPEGSVQNNVARVELPLPPPPPPPAEAAGAGPPSTTGATPAAAPPPAAPAAAPAAPATTPAMTPAMTPETAAPAAAPPPGTGAPAQ